MSKEILIKPILSEKSYSEISFSKYTFEIPISINKIELKKFIKAKYNVDVINVSTVTVRQKKKRIGITRNFRTTKLKRKAIVTLKKGQTIDGFSVK